MKVILIYLCSLCSLIASETIFPVTDAKVRAMLGGGVVSVNLMLSSAGIEDSNESSLFVGVPKLDTWMMAESDGIRGKVKITKTKAFYRLHWLMKRDGKTLSGNQPMEFAGDEPMFEPSYLFSKETKKVKEVSSRAVLLQSIPVDFSMALADSKEAISIRGQVDVFYEDGVLVAQQKTIEKKLRYNVGVKTEEDDWWFVDCQLDEILNVDFLNTNIEVLEETNSYKRVKIKYGCVVAGRVRCHISKEPNFILEANQLRKVVPFYKEIGLAEGAKEADLSEVFVCYKVGDEKSIEKIIDLPKN